MSSFRNRSRSPTRSGNGGRRRDSNKQQDMQNGDNMSSNASNMMNPMMMQNMFSQGNMLMSGMYPNMMMGNMGSMISNTGMDMMSNSGMDIMQQGSMEISPLPQPPLPPGSAPGMDMSMMGGMMVDPSMIGNMGNMGNMANMGTMANMGNMANMGMFQTMPNVGAGDMAIVEKKEIILKHVKLTPPGPGNQEPPRRAKPPGCRTVFVGGLPDKIRESHVREIFENYGRIHTLRLSTKNFCHIRFDRESCVDAAMFLSGYHIKLLSGKEDEDKDDTKATTGWLHVDYALSRDDQNEFERRQKHMLRVQEEQLKQLSAQQKAISSRMRSHHRSPSPDMVQPFSNASMVQLAEKIKNEEYFATALPTLITWLERGDCSKKNSTQFYSMIQATNSHIRRLFNEKMQSEEELQECKERIKNNIERVLDQLEQVAKVFAAATHQRVWDHFTKPQRKNIETWQKMTQEFNALKEEFNEKFNSEDNEYNSGFNSNRSMDMDSNEELQNLKRENESLQFQLEAYKNEVDVIKSDARKELEKFKAQFIARQALQEAMDKNPPLPKPEVKPPPPPPLPADVKEVDVTLDLEAGNGEARLIAVMAAFLQVHPQGASLDYVVSYVRAIFPSVSHASIHEVLQKHKDVFECTTKGVGANIELRWSFVAFQNKPLPTSGSLKT